MSDSVVSSCGATPRGYALGSGNFIPEYVPVDNYLAMVRGARKMRELE